MLPHRSCVASTQLPLSLLARKTRTVRRAHNETAPIHARRLRMQTLPTWWDRTCPLFMWSERVSYKWLSFSQWLTFFFMLELLCPVSMQDSQLSPGVKSPSSRLASQIIGAEDDCFNSEHEQEQVPFSSLFSSCTFCSYNCPVLFFSLASLRLFVPGECAV